MYSKEFKVIYNVPKIIVWDSLPGIEGNENFVRLEYTFWLTPKNLINIPSGSIIVVRPELRIKDQKGIQVASIICEYYQEIHFLSKRLPSIEGIMSITRETHKFFAQTFHNTMNMTLDTFSGFPFKDVRESIFKAMKKADWI